MKTIIKYSDLTQAERQAFAEFQLKEKRRHFDDIAQINSDLEFMANHYGIKPKGIFKDKWIEVKE